jgi:3-oxoacyl-[acyl-carrier protein] reductase
MTGAADPRRVALITGASRGIGAATARLLAVRGMRVAVNYRASRQEADGVVAAITADGGEALAVQADVRDQAAVLSMVTEVGSAWGVVDVLVHNALIPYAIKSFHDITWDELGGKLEQEMRSAFGVTNAVLPGMISQGYGRIVYLGTGLSQRPREGMIALGTSKAALTQFARFVAQEVAAQGITVNVVSPGPVAGTTLTDVLGPELKRQQVAATPLGRMATPDDVARVVAFYAGDDSGFITGTVAPVSGGMDMD